MKRKTNLTLEEATREQLRRLAEGAGVSQSAIVDELVEIAGAAVSDARPARANVLGPAARHPGCMG